MSVRNRRIRCNAKFKQQKGVKMKTFWIVEAVFLKNGEKVDLGSKPYGGVEMTNDNELLSFVSYDGIVRVYPDDVAFVIEGGKHGGRYSIEEFQCGDFSIDTEHQYNF
jgi:hypothetical protein